MRCNGHGTIYVDGTFRHNTTSATEVWTEDLSPDASLIAVRCLKVREGALGYYAGLVAAFSNGLVSGTDWKCSDGVGENWYNTGANDSQWDNAEVQTIPTPYGGAKPNFPTDASWIWSTNTNRYDRGEPATHCRRRIGITKL